MPSRQSSRSRGSVRIGHDVWIGSGVNILSGATIGNGAIIGARSVVTRDVSDYEIVGGNPAVTLRKRFEDQIMALLLRLEWWTFETRAIRELADMLCAPPDAAVFERMIAIHRPELITKERDS